jgi:hypothetical protein
MANTSQNHERIASSGDPGDELGKAGNAAIDEGGKIGTEAVDSITDIFNGGASKSDSSSTNNSSNSDDDND